MFLYLLLCALVLVGARADRKRPTGSVEFEQPKADFEPFSKAIVFNDEDFTKYQDCNEILASGSYKEAGAYWIYLNQSEPIVVFCEFEAGDPSYVLLMRKYGNVSFVQNFNSYEIGFGNIAAGDGWIGLSRIKALADAGYNVLRVTMQDCQNTLKTIVYSHFSLGPKPDYKLNIYGYASDKVLPDDFSANNGRPFATIDKQDEHACALHMRAGWWYNFCSNTLPTGKYYQPCGPYTPPGQYYDGLYYTDWRGRDYSLKFFKMELSVE